MSEHRTLIWLLCVVVTLWLCAMFGLTSHFEGDLGKAGQFGDLFGSVNALFSGFAFAGLFYTILLQQKQLSIQQAELSLQRQELRLQREEMTASRAELSRQVLAQQALAKATVAQISVAGMNAQIEAYKLRAEGLSHSSREEFITSIESASVALSALAKKLETEQRDDA